MARDLRPRLAGGIIPASAPLTDSDILLTDHDAVVSIGIIIHAPDPYLVEFASQVRNLVAPDGMTCRQQTVPGFLPEFRVEDRANRRRYIPY